MKHIKFLLFASFLSLMAVSASGQEEKPKIYHPEADAKIELANAVKKAMAEDKHVLLQVGGNW